MATLSVFTDHSRPTPAPPARAHIATLALIGAVLLVANPTAHAQRPNPPALPSIAGPWGANIPDPNGSGSMWHVYVTIAPGATRGTYTINGGWNNGGAGDWGTAPLNLGRVTQAGFSASARLTSCDAGLEFSWASKNNLVLRLRSHWVDNGVAHSKDLAPITLVRAGYL